MNYNANMRHTRLFFVMILTLCMGLAMQAQTTPTITPVTSTEGYDFYTTFLPNGNALRKSEDLKLQFLVSSREDNVVTVQCGNDREDYDVSAGSSRVIDMNSDYAYWDITDEQGQVEKPLNLGVHIYSKNGAKMTVYAVNQSGTNKSSLTLDGSHVLPKQALGHEYIVECNSEENIATEFVVMSTRANTNVTIQLPDGVTTSKKSTGTLKATFTQPYMIYIVRVAINQETPSDLLDLSGTTICADQPVAVWSGNQAARFTTDKPATADHAFDQLLPIEHWGTQFIVPLTGIQTQINKLDIIARDPDTKVTISSKSSSQTQTLGSAEKWSRLVDVYHTKGLGFTLEDSTIVVQATKPVQVYLYTSSAVFNGHLEHNIPQYQGDPSMTMIVPLEHLTDTAIFSTYKNPIATTNPNPTEDDVLPMSYELVVWAKKSTVSSLRLKNNVRDNVRVEDITSFKSLPGDTYRDYRFARIPISSEEEGYQILTAAEKGFGGYVCGLEEGQACLYPIGYNFKPVEDSLFLSKKYEPKEVHGGEFDAKYPDKANGGGWYLDKVVLPDQPTQYDTIFICDSTKLRFPAILHNDWKEIKWEVLRIDQSNQKRSEYEEAPEQERNVSTDLSNPYLETKFFVLPEKNRSAKQRHPYEDFEVRAVLYREPLLCSDLDQEDWPKDTLSTIVRTYRSYNDTTWLIKCTNDLTTEDNITYQFKYFINPDTKEPETLDLVVGENDYITRKYTTVNGCENDSIVTVRVLLCQSDVDKRGEVYLCENDLEDPDALRTQLNLGEFFKTFDFLGTLQASKKNNNTGISGDGWKWTYFADKLYWQFTGTDIIRTEDCNDKMKEWHDKYGAAYPRATIGCDKSLTITLDVWPITEFKHDDITTCQNQVTWEFDYNWYDGHFTKHESITYRLGQGGIHEGTNYIVQPYQRATYPPGTGFSGCIGERHIVNITFLKDHEIHTKKVELCNDDPILVVNKTSDPDIADDTYSWPFNPRDHRPGVYTGEVIECINNEGCSYNLQYQITVNPVEIHQDTVVYCYDNGSQVEHRWEGHSTFWANEKGKTTKTRYNDASKPLRINRPKADKTKDTRIIYELADTLYGNPCHVIYYQTVILLPPYSTSEERAAISTKQWFEWHNVIWAGERVLTDTIPNPQDKTIYVLKEYGRAPAPEGWEPVSYTAGNYTYALTTTTTTRPYRRDDGSWTASCDSTVQLLVQIADEQEEHKYTWTCNDGSYEWIAGDTTIYVDLADYQDPALLPKTLHREEHRKTKKPYWPVEGIGAHFYLDLTVYPSYLLPVDSAACQEPGKTVVFKGHTFSLNEPGMQERGNHLKTEPKIWINPDTHEEEIVQCDSGEVVRMFVYPIYREDVNKDLSSYQRTLYTHDTLTFFTEPKVLFVGKDFLTTHPEISGLEELKNIAGVDSALVIDETLVPALAVAETWGGYFDTLQVSPVGTYTYECDSTTFLDMIVRKTIVLDPVSLGDNGNRLDGVSTPWSFGGDTTIARPADGTRYNTFPLITGDYFRFYYDENGNVVGEVDYEDDYDRAKGRDYHYNEDGTRTYLLIDSVLNKDGTLDVYVQYVTVFPTFLINDIDASTAAGTVCATDTYVWAGHFNDEEIEVSKYALVDRKAYIRDTVCSKRYNAAPYNICVDSICILVLNVAGNGKVKRDYPRCFNDPAWAPDWARTGSEVCYEVGGAPSVVISNEIPQPDPSVPCIDIYEGTIYFNPAYGATPCTGTITQQYRQTYIEPYNYDTTICQHDDDFHWLLKNGEEHVPSNLYLYDANDNPLELYGNTNKVPGNIVPTDLAVGFYTVRDSLKTVGCYCDSVLSLHYELRDALDPETREATICKGETYLFGDTILKTEGTYTRYIQEEGKPCKTKTTLTLSIEDASKFKIEPTPVCFGDANTETTYAIHYSYKGHYYPISFSVHYDEASQELGFNDIIDQEIVRPASDWKADSVYVLDLPMPMLESREDYPEPGVFSATIGFKNGVCAGEDLMTYSFEVKINYPGWIMEQRHGDMIVLLDANHNGGHEWTSFQWYRDGWAMPGYTKPYLYVPEGLLIGSEYYVVLTETDDAGEVITSAPTCPIIAQEKSNSASNPDTDHGPSSDYIAVTPTCVPLGGSIHILSLNEKSHGEYRISTVEGQFVSKGEFTGKATPVSIPSVEGMYIVQVWSDNKESKESYRAIKVIVRDTCPNCDKSSF